MRTQRLTQKTAYLLLLALSAASLGALSLDAFSPPQALAQAGAGPLLDQLEVSRYIPAEALYVGAFDGLQQAYDRLGLADLASTYKPHYDELTRELIRETGFNLLDPAVLKSLGLAIDKPMGGALLSIEEESGLFFAQASDPALFLKTVRDLISKSGGRVAEIPVPGATLLCEDRSKKDVCLAVKDAHVLFIISDKGKADTLSQRILGLTVAESISGQPIYKDALKATAAAQFAGLLQTAPLHRMVLDEIKRKAENPELAKLKADLAAAKTSGAPPADIQRFEEDLKWQQEWQDRQMAEIKIIEKLLSGTQSIIMSVQANPASLEGAVVTSFSGDSFVAAALQTPTSTPAIYTALDALPMFLASAQVKPDKALEMIELLAASEGESIDELGKKLKLEMSLDLRLDILMGLSGEAGLAITVDSKALMAAKGSSSDTEKLFGGTLTIGFKDKAQLQKILDKLTAHPGFAKMATKTGDHWAVENPWKKVYFGAVGSTLVVTTDEPALARVAAGGRGLLDKLSNPDLKKLLNSKDVAASMVLDQTTLLTFFMLGSSKMEDATPPMPSASTPEQKKAYEDLQKVNAELAKLRETRDAAANARFLKLSEQIGPQAMTISVAPSKISIQGGLYFNTPTLAALVKAAVQAGVETATDPSDAAISTLYEKRWELERILYSSP